MYWRLRDRFPSLTIKEFSNMRWCVASSGIDYALEHPFIGAFMYDPPKKR